MRKKNIIIFSLIITLAMASNISSSNVKFAVRVVAPPFGYTTTFQTDEGIIITIKVDDNVFDIPTRIEIQLVKEELPEFYLMQSADFKTSNIPISAGYDIVVKDINGKELSEDKFLDKVKISFTYPSNYNLAQVNLLRICRLNENTENWLVITGHKIDVRNKIISVDVQHFSIFRLFLAVSCSVKEVIVYPNPFYVDRTLDSEVKFTNLPKGEITLHIYNIAGERVFERTYPDASGGITWNGKNNRYVATGLYIYYLKGANGDEVKGKLSLIR